jgi:hypothetical protein
VPGTEHEAVVSNADAIVVLHGSRPLPAGPPGVRLLYGIGLPRVHYALLKLFVSSAYTMGDTTSAASGAEARPWMAYHLKP